MAAQPNRFFASHLQGPIGSFHHGLGLVEINWSDEARALRDDPGSIHRYDADPQKQLRLVLEYTAVIHERIHHLHTFGTVAGVSLFTARLDFLRQFTRVAVNLRLAGTPWELPLTAWTQRADCPLEVKQLRRIARSFEVGSRAFLGAFQPFVQPEITEESWIIVPYQPPEKNTTIPIPAFPKSFSIQTADGQESHDMSLVYPLGYEAIIEGVAHSVVRSFAEQQFPSVSRDLMAQYGLGRLELVHDPTGRSYPQQFVDSQYIYNVTDFMVSKFLRSHAIHAFPRDLVLRVSDIALSMGMVVVKHDGPAQSEIRWRMPGMLMIELLQKTAVAELSQGRIGYPSSIDKHYRFFQEHIEQNGDWHTVVNKEDFLRATHVWESFVAQNISRPLLDKRLATHHSSFATTEGLLELVFREPLPRIEVMNGSLKFENVPEEVRRAWCILLFLNEIAQQVFADSRVLRCPRAHRLLPGMDRLDVANGRCNKHERLGCGSWIPGESKYSPDCLFTHSLREYGFIRGVAP
ncbi:MAG TPA: hypothetical protein VNO35_07605 [Steroidobacteraceae bacterium]|nr:hypothetical protein [Steroidobacteraceae bacterium]